MLNPAIMPTHLSPKPKLEITQNSFLKPINIRNRKNIIRSDLPSRLIPLNFRRMERITIRKRIILILRLEIIFILIHRRRLC